jgi:succinate dehydrogenase/fumarate reductase flavoprotein subunit
MKKQTHPGVQKVVEMKQDVLIIGSGVAGVRAAIEARRSGLEVLLVDKSLLGRASCSIYAGGIVHPKIPEHMERMGFNVPNKLALPPDKLTKKFLEEGVALGWGYPYLDDQRLMMVIAVELGLRNEELRDFGVKDPYLQHYLGPPGLYGKNILLPMIEYMEKIGVTTLEKTMILELLQEDNTIIGAIGFNIDDGTLYVFRAKSVVLASGGGAQIYERTYSPTRMTGDGFVMAFQAGAELWDMELIGWDNWFLNEPGLPRWWISYSHGRMSGVLKNKLGEPFFEKYARKFGVLGEKATLSLKDPKDKRYGRPIIELVHYFARASAAEILEGRGENGSVLLDLTSVPEDLWKIESAGLFALNLFRDFDWKKKLVHIAPCAEKSCGGITINERGETTVKGLYAAGEVANGSSMPFCLVTGVLAGRHAAHYAHEKGALQSNSVIETQVRDVEHRILQVFKREPDPKGESRTIKKRMKSIMMNHAGVLKTEKGLQTALDQLEQIREENLSKVYARGLREAREAFETINMWMTSDMVVKASLHRKESRGLHQRVDYPERDDEHWLKNVLIKKEGKKMVVYDRPVDLVFFSPQPGKR